MRNLANTVLLIEPTQFAFNEEASITNSFQEKPSLSLYKDLQQKAHSEFQNLVKKLNDVNVNTLVYKDIVDSQTPDSIFPNNWFSTHESGKIVIYPMAVSNRRAERRKDIIEDLIRKYCYQIEDLTLNEHQNPPRFLEGTGSMVFDHANKIVFAAISPRTNKDLLDEVGLRLGYQTCAFKAFGKEQELIYHTNVMMCIGETFAAVGDRTIDKEERDMVVRRLAEKGKELILLTNEQVYSSFAGNMLQITNRENQTILVLSKSAFDSLNSDQSRALKKHNDHILCAEIPTIEKIGGGSVRCMLAEIFTH